MTPTSTISERILSIIQHLNLSTNDFAMQLGYSRSQVLYDILKLKSKPSYSFFEKLHNSIFNDVFSMEWLITGQGEMLNAVNSNRNEQLSKEIEVLHALNETQKSLIDIQKKEISRLESISNMEILNL